MTHLNGRYRGTRLTWLDSDLGIAGDTVPPPFTPLKVTPGDGTVPSAGGRGRRTRASGSGFVASMLDKKITVGGPFGLPTAGQWHPFFSRPIILCWLQCVNTAGVLVY